MNEKEEENSVLRVSEKKNEYFLREKKKNFLGEEGSLIQENSKIIKNLSPNIEALISFHFCFFHFYFYIDTMKLVS